MFASLSLQLSFRPDLNVFTCRWLTASELATTPVEYEALLHAPDAPRTPRWLFDVRRRPTTDATAARWVTTDWLPRAAGLVRPARLSLAFLVPPARAEHLRAEADLRAVMEAAYAPGHAFSLRTFTDEGEAMRWLLAQPDKEA
ncbi:hypothetical protein [Hymenobacter rubidus]|uniref:hypothetical protein n=1 Tax=Hymenobacter rubidus TaxID=1441626 RepID=UPI00191E2F9B|nr:hypothetical protein [Hymenobacter rubidus]